MSYVVKDYMTREVITVSSGSNIIEAAKIMAADKNYGGYAVVLKDLKPVGIITERDVINKALAADLDPVKTEVSAIMSSPLATVDPDDNLLNAAKLMREKNVRKLVVTRDGIIYGILTARNVAQNCGDYVEKSVRDALRWTAPLGL